MRDYFLNLTIKGLGLLAGFGLSFFGPIWKFLLVVFFLVMTDLFTGIKAARRRKERIHSKGLRRSINKICWYFLAIILTRVVEMAFFDDTWIQNHLTLVYMVAGFIASVEFQSNIENIGELTGIDIWSRIKNKINDLFKSEKP